MRRLLPLAVPDWCEGRLAWRAAAALVALVLVNLGIGATWMRGLPDFFAFWSAAKFVRLAAAGLLYDEPGLHHFQLTLGLGTEHAPFLYPPSALLLFRPLGLLSYRAAFAVWVAIGLAAYVTSLLPGERRLRGVTILTILAAPATVLCAVAGQIGLLFSGLLIGGLRLADTRPLLGGMLLGLATVKPQLAVLVPVALVAALRWRALVAAGATAIALVLLSGALFGPSTWASWVGALPRIAELLNSVQPLIGQAMPTVAGNLRLLGAGPALIVALQLSVAAGTAWVVWRTARRSGIAGATPLVLAGSLLCTAYALWFDLPLLTGAGILLVQQWSRAGRAPGTAALMLLILAFYLPYLMIGLAPFPLSAGVVMLFMTLAAGSVEPWHSRLARPLGAA